MKNTKKAFTLVELIVVITILAVLATVAFISFSGQTKEANKSKVVSDLANLSKAIEIATTSPKNLVTSGIANNQLNSSARVNSGSTLSGGVNYNVGLINFTTLGQNGDEFKDPKGKGYLLAYYASGSFNKYQVVGQVENATGDNQAFIKGSYYSVAATDAKGLVTFTGASAATASGGLSNGDIIGASTTSSLY